MIHNIDGHKEDDDAPTLVGQLKLLREFYGDGFDKDIAQPLAAALVAVRKGLEGEEQRLRRKLEEAEDQLEDAEMNNREGARAIDERDRMRDDLNDVRLGVLDFQELHDRWCVRVP